MSLNLDRGVITRFHPSGIKVSAYIDSPGEYYTEAGEPLDRKFAEQAGFDVEGDARKKLINQRVRDYREELEAQMRSEEEQLAVALTNTTEYDVRHVGGGQYALFGKDGVQVTKSPMSQGDIELLIGRPVKADEKVTEK
ncbi:MAG: hypothetical protein ACWGPN_11560 [Gammaproteobacteria bacterium]